MSEILDLTWPGKKDETYTHPGYCTNCRKSFDLKLSKGYEIPSWVFPRECPHCGCRSIVGK